MKADLVARVTGDLASLKEQQQHDCDGGDHLVTELSPQARLLRQLAEEASTKPVDGDWDIKPHPLLVAAAPTREQFDAEHTAPVVIMRNPIGGKQVSGRPLGGLDSCCRAAAGLRRAHAPRLRLQCLRGARRPGLRGGCGSATNACTTAALWVLLQLPRLIDADAR